MRREGSPWQGLGAVTVKELADHFGSVRMLMLVLLMVLAAAVPLYGAIEQLRNTTAEGPFLLLKLFNPPGSDAISRCVLQDDSDGDRPRSDAINGAQPPHLVRILAQPIYRTPCWPENSWRGSRSWRSI